MEVADTRSDDPVLEVDGLTVRLRTSRGDVEALRSVSLHVDQGETVGLVGESGCGKSLTALSIAGLLPPMSEVSGEIRLCGRNLTNLDRRARRQIGGREIGMVFQDPVASLNPVLSVGGQLAEVARHHLGSSRREAKALATEMLDKVGIPPSRNILKDYPHQLSGGMGQRVSIAAALICQPKLVIGDEPTTALDVTIQAQILELLRSAASDSGASLLLITHDLGVVARICDRVVVMYAGEIVESGPTSKILSAPSHPYTAALLKSVPDPEVETDELETISGSVPELHEMPEGCRFAARCEYADAACAVDPPLEVISSGASLRCWHPVGGMNSAGGTGGLSGRRS
jgi:oligopeptide/dipeptide ABC transporter ATP-binding protein